MNLADTAGVNQANQINAQNSFNLSEQSVAMLWQELRDEAAWAQESSENALTRALQIDVENIKADAEINAALAKAGGELVHTVATNTDWGDLASTAWDWITTDSSSSNDWWSEEDWGDWEL
jgi:hypothetical protein